MRITNSQRYTSLQDNIGASLSALDDVQRQIATGKKLTTFSDDPGGASQSLSLRAALLDNAQYQRDADAAKSFLSAGDSALSGANALLQSARQIAVAGANSAQSPESFAALGEQVGGLISQLTQVANSDLHGKYLFGGTQTGRPPFDSNQNYGGNAEPLVASIGPGYTVQVNAVGSAAFGPAFSALKQLQSDLAKGDVAAVSQDIGQVGGALSTTSAAQAALGARLDEVTTVKQRLTRAQGEYQDAVSNIEDVDLSQAYVQLQSAQNIYQASLVTTSKAFQYSLADYLH